MYTIYVIAASDPGPYHNSVAIPHSSSCAVICQVPLPHIYLVPIYI